MSIPSLVAAGRRIIGTTLLDRVIPWVESQVSDGQGGVVSTWTAYTGDDEQIPCKFGVLSEADQRGRSLRANDGAVEGYAATALLVDISVVIAEGTRLVDAATGRIWQVIGETTPPSATAVVRRILIREL